MWVFHTRLVRNTTLHDCDALCAIMSSLFGVFHNLWAVYVYSRLPLMTTICPLETRRNQQWRVGKSNRSGEIRNLVGVGNYRAERITL